MLSLLLKQHHLGNVVDAFMSAAPKVFSSALTLVTFVLVVVSLLFSKVFKLKV